VGWSVSAGNSEIGADGGEEADASTLFPGWSGFGLASAAAGALGGGALATAGVDGAGLDSAVGCKVGDAIDAALGSVAEAAISFVGGAGWPGGVRVWVGTAGNAALITGAADGAGVAGTTATAGNGVTGEVAAAGVGAAGLGLAGALASIGRAGSAGLGSAGFSAGAITAVATGVSVFETDGQLVGGAEGIMSCGERCAMTTFATTPTATA
jgi:hypothetical protein